MWASVSYNCMVSSVSVGVSPGPSTECRTDYEDEVWGAETGSKGATGWDSRSAPLALLLGPSLSPSLPTPPPNTQFCLQRMQINNWLGVGRKTWPPKTKQDRSWGATCHINPWRRECSHLKRTCTRWNRDCETPTWVQDRFIICTF